MSDTIFITGATGSVGRELVPLLLTETDAKLILLVRQKGPNSGSFAGEGRIELVVGDVTQPGLALAGEDRELIESTTTRIVHCAP
jgi:thioester reductase-like protein